MSALARWALRNGVRKGLLGGSNAWTIVAVAAGIVRFSQRGQKPKASTMLSLRPGDRYSIRCDDDSTQRATP
jgi:hypothetical protein